MVGLATAVVASAADATVGIELAAGGATWALEPQPARATTAAMVATTLRNCGGIPTSFAAYSTEEIRAAPRPVLQQAGPSSRRRASLQLSSAAISVRPPRRVAAVGPVRGSAETGRTRPLPCPPASVP